ncbi:hypothetical protein I302_107196 [Kwoniella bestiolae CBS 10118]|uniref:NAD(P)-binding domain-containing protein n=1 Tax=Kwoniella bestiolae CBS 10118 TaxID=1296100 RepID=A0A1B9FZ98_9TREE|nr:hypothetical protein I302_05538 [Kwoniella bestiolae CBS 10118]OCF24081.1 hypothetical protein I302_05538 [Kwoniella bestiolae CBS 10118]
MSTENILLLGATGASGIAFLEHVLTIKDGPRLSLLVRNKAKLPQGLIAQYSERVTVVEGQLDDETKLEDVMKNGITSVVGLLGAYPSLYHLISRSTPTPIADSLHVIKRVMKRYGVRRLLALSTPRHSVPGEVYTWPQYITTQFIPSIFMPQGSAEMTAISEVCADDDFDYTIFRVPFLSASLEDRKVYAGFYGPDYKGSQELSRASLAKWIYQEIQERNWVQKQPVLGNY